MYIIKCIIATVCRTSKELLFTAVVSIIHSYNTLYTRTLVDAYRNNNFNNIITIFLYNIKLCLSNVSSWSHNRCTASSKSSMAYRSYYYFLHHRHHRFSTPVWHGGVYRWRDSAHGRRHPLCRGGSSNLATSLTQHNIYIHALFYYYYYNYQ